MKALRSGALVALSMLPILATAVAADAVDNVAKPDPVLQQVANDYQQEVYGQSLFANGNMMPCLLYTSDAADE